MFAAKRETVIKASPEKIFAIVSDLTRHAELAGSKEVLKIRVLTEGPVRAGTRFEADEDIREPKMMKTAFVAQSEVTACDAPKRFAWYSTPPMKPALRVTWQYALEPRDGGTRVAQSVKARMTSPLVQIFMGVPMMPMYALTRGKIVTRGMEQTLQNLKSAAEK